MFIRLAILFFLFVINLNILQASDGLECQRYLNSKKLILTDSLNFNTNLAGISNPETLEIFVTKFFEVVNSDPLIVRKPFIKSGLIDLENISAPFLAEISIQARERLLKVMSLNLHVVRSVNFLVSLENATLKDLPTMKAEELSGFIFLMGKLRLKPSDSFLEVLSFEVVNKIKDFQPRMMSNLVFGFGQLGFKPNDDLLKAWRERYKENHLDFDKVSIVNSIFSFYLMGSSEMVKWFARATSEEKWKSIKNKDHIERRQVSLVFEYFFRVENYVLKPIQRFQGHFKDLIRVSGRQTSEIEDQYEMRLAMSGVDYVKEYQTIPGFFVDFYIPAENKVIQIDGPSHFIKEVKDNEFVEFQRPQDDLIDKILRSFGYQVKRISYKKL